MNAYPIELDKTRYVRLGFQAQSIVNKKIKKNMYFEFNIYELTPDELATVLYAGLLHEDKNLSVDRVMYLIDEYSNFTEVTKVLMQAYMGAFGKEIDLDTINLDSEEDKDINKEDEEGKNA